MNHSPVRYQAFADALQSAQVGTFEHEMLDAGFAVLQLFDDWCTTNTAIEPGQVLADEVLEKIAIAARYGSAEVVEALHLVVQSMTNAANRHPSFVVGALLAYAAFTEQAIQWRIAECVYANIIVAYERQPVESQADLAIVAQTVRKQAFCLRQLGMYDDSESAYLRAMEYAKKAQNDRVWLEAKGGWAAVYRCRGDFDKAEAIINEALDDCASLDLSFRGDILHGLAAVKHDRGDFAASLKWIEEAYSLSTNEAWREFMLFDWGVTAGDAGFRETAKHVLGLCTRPSVNPRVRHLAIANLMHFAVEDRDRSAFDHYRTLWQPEYCEPLSNGDIRKFIALGLEVFVGPQEAIAELVETVEFAKRHGLAKLVRDVEEELARLYVLEKEFQSRADVCAQ